MWPGKPIITRNDLGSTATFDGMTVVLASVIAVLGTLGGATASYLFQGKISERNESKARRTAAGRAAGSLQLFCRSGDGPPRHLVRSRLQPHGGPPARSVKYPSGVLPLRSVAWTAFYRFKLTSPDQQLTNFAARAVEEAFDVVDASDKVDLKKRSERARARIDEFISAAATQLETG
jgi:hypothetical protein